MTAEEKGSTFTINGEQYDLLGDDQLTAAECMALEEMSGMALLEFSEAIGRFSAKALVPWALIHVQRKHRDATLDDLGGLNFAELIAGIKAADAKDEDTDPTEAVPNGEPKKQRDGSPTSSNGSRGSEASPAAAGNQPSATTSA